MIYESHFQLGTDNQEILPGDSGSFPYVCITREWNTRTDWLDNCIPWHWHTAFELDYVAAGSVELESPNHRTIVKKGEAFFINTNVLHRIQASVQGDSCSIFAHVFDAHFLTGMYGGSMDETYIYPMIKGRNLDFFVLSPDSYPRLKMLELTLEMIELARTEPFGYEFELRSALCRFWCMLLKETAPLRCAYEKKSPADTDRLRLMMDYIHTHYMEKISLNDIAAAASISTRECTRCFRRTIRLSPMAYLNQYRIRTAAQLLLQTDDPILTISENCGFSSGSYFGRIFQELMHCTPREYRQK